MRRYLTINEKWMGWRGRTWKMCVEEKYQKKKIG